MASSQKTRFDLVPFQAIGEIADVLAFGAQKYSANNWCRGAEWSRYYSALCRHIFAWWQGEDLDPETGLSHLAHAGCCLVFLMEYQRNAWGTDDRFKGPDGESFTKHDGRTGESMMQLQQELDLFGVLPKPEQDYFNTAFAVDWDQVGCIPEGVATDEQQEYCFVGPDGEPICKRAPLVAINDDDDGLT